MGKLRPIVELGVAEAHAILTGPLGVASASLPPIGALENEDWGRDLLLGRFLEFSPQALAQVGLRLGELVQGDDASSGETTEAP